LFLNIVHQLILDLTVLEMMWLSVRRAAISSEIAARQKKDLPVLIKRENPCKSLADASGVLT
jgi:hypothetical protein